MSLAAQTKLGIGGEPNHTPHFIAELGEVHSKTRLTDGMIVLITLSSCGVGVLSSLIGVGGRLVIFPFLVLYTKSGPQMAAGANSLILTVSSPVVTIRHFAMGNVDIRFLAVTSLACVLVSTVGSHVTVKASPSFVRVAFAFIMWFFITQIALRLRGLI